MQFLVTACHENVDKFVCVLLHTLELHPQAKGRMKQDPLKRGAKIGLCAADDKKAGVCQRSMPFLAGGPLQLGKPKIL